MQSIMENQEQNLHSKDIKIDNFVIEPLSQPYRVTINVSYDELRNSFDNFWKNNGDSILRKFNVVARNKGNARSMVEKNLGYIKIYRNILADIVKEVVGDNLFFVNSIELEDFEPDMNTKIIAFIYLMPELEINDGFHINWEMNDPIKSTVDDELTRTLKEIQYKNREFVNSEDDIEITDRHRVVLDVLSSCEGVTYDRGIVRNHTVDVEMLQKEIREKIVGHKKGEHFEVSYIMDDRDPEYVGKQMDLSIRILDVINIIEPDIDDKLIEGEGFENMEAFESKFRKDCQNYMENARLGYAMDHVLNQIIHNCVIPPIPHIWIENNVNSFMENHMSKFNSRKEAMMSLNVRKEDDLRSLFRNRVIQSLVQDLALRQYMKMNELCSKNVDMIGKHIMERIKWVK